MMKRLLSLVAIGAMMSVSSAYAVEATVTYNPPSGTVITEFTGFEATFDCEIAASGSQGGYVFLNGENYFTKVSVTISEDKHTAIFTINPSLSREGELTVKYFEWLINPVKSSYTIPDLRPTYTISAAATPTVNVGDTFEADGIYYVLGENECYVTTSPADAPYTGEINIPAEVTVNGSAVPVTKIAAAFAGTSTMTSLTIPGSVTEIEHGALIECTGLTTLRFEYGETPLSGVEQYRMGRKTYTTFMNAPVQNIYLDRDFVNYGAKFTKIENLETGDNVKNIPTGFCTSNPLRTLNLGKSIETIGERAFASTQIEELYIPGNVKTIGSNAFESCSNLVKVVFDDSITEVGNSKTTEDGMPICRNIFSNCIKLTDVKLPADLKTLGIGVFYRCESLAQLALPEGLEEIGPTCLCGTGIIELDVPGSVKWIGVRAIESPLEKITLHEGLERLDIGAISSKMLTKLEIPSTVQYLNRITTRELYGYHTTDLQATAIGRISNLTEVVIAPENPYFIVVDGVIYNKDMTSLVACIPTKEGTLDIPESVTKIERYALNDCYKLEGVKLPSNLTTIEPGAFCNTNFKTLTIPATVETIGRFLLPWPFNELHVASPTPINNFTKIDESDAIVPTDEFFTTEFDATLYVPTESVELYKADANWGKFEQIEGQSSFDGIVSLPAMQGTDTEYYNLNGIKVSTPVRGLYISGSGKKVMVK